MNYEVYLVIGFLFVLGLFVGSFLNLISDRIFTDRSVFLGRSVCNFCQKVLSPLELVPFFSFIFLRGKCLGCKEKLSWHYPASEILTGVVFAIAGYFSKFYLNIAAFNVVYFLFLLTIFSSYLVIFFTDIKFNLIPDKVVFPTIYFVIVGTIGFKVYQLFDYYNFLKNDNFGKFMLEAGYFNDVVLSNAKTIGFGFLAAFIIAAFFVLLILITKGRGMGLGDVKLGFLIGLFNGFPNAFLAIFLGFLFGAVFSIVLVALRLKKIKDTIAFGPFLIMGSFVAYFWGQVILDWYVKMFS